MSNYAIAKQYHEAGLNIIPLKSKRQPRIRYAQYHEQKYPWYECRRWFACRQQSGIAIICGKTSGGLEVLDFDFQARTIFPKWYSIINSHPTTHQISTTLPIVRTPKDGVHVYYRCRQIEGNQKLAMDMEQVAIETRGQGGYVVAPGTPAYMHPSNRPYRCVRGSLDSIPIITPEQRDTLIMAARGFDRRPHQISAPTDRGSSLACVAPNPTNSQNRPGDRFNRQATWQDILEPHGWTLHHTSGQIEYWTRPNKHDGGWSATTNYAGLNKLIVHSTNAAPFQTTSYDKFAAYALLNFNGDFRKAAKELSQ